ncbi:MAG: trypsin-like peptidase domain-containing protein [Verrucomicrobia bacterium]|nr:trypsin-like peptidase domain-containing protein [Verrucomicrobiota bacterium]
MKLIIAKWGTLILLLCVVGCASTELGGSAKPVVINDRAIIGEMTREATRMMDSDGLVSMELLIEQLKKEPRVSLNLAAGKGARTEDAQKAIAVVGGVYKCDRCTRWHVAPASGFLIAEDLVVTNYHVVNQPERAALAVRLFDSRVFMVESVVASSERFDLAVLRIPKTGVTPVALGQAAPVGAKVDLISHPNQHFYTLSEGRVARYFMTRRNRKAVSAMSITADFGRGSSGAPVLNPSGEVVGIVASTESLYYTEKDGEQKNLQMVFKNCVPVSQLRELIGG